MSGRYGAIIVGGGHNGLVCAALLAKAGRRVLVLEANDRVGGAAITREFADGYSVSAGAHLVYQLQDTVVKDLKPELDFAAEDLQTIALAPDGAHLRMTPESVDGASEDDAERYIEFQLRMSRFADLLRTQLNRTPPRLGTGRARDLLALGKLGFDIRRLGRDEMREFLRLIGMNIRDELVEKFDSRLLRGAISLDAVLGTHLGPRSPNTIMTYLYRLAGNQGRLSLPAGGMGRVSEALADSAKHAGAEIREEAA